MTKSANTHTLHGIPVRVTETTKDGTVALYVGPYPLSGVVETKDLRPL